MDQEKHIMLAQGRRCNGGAFFRKNITHFLAAFLMIAFLGILGFMEMQRSYQDQRIVELSERMESRAIVQDETMSKQNQSLSHLKTEVQNLRSELATESRKQAETQEELDQLAYQLNQSLSQLLLDFCSQSGNSTVKLQQSATSDARLQGEIDKLHKSLQTSLSDVKERQDALTKKIDSVKKNGFGNCRSSYDTCNIGSSGNGRYWKDCSTQFFPKEEEGYLTLDARCLYSVKSGHKDYSETLTLFEEDGRIRCDCDVTFPGEDKVEHRPVDKNLNAQCIITIIRCPTSL